MPLVHDQIAFHNVSEIESVPGLAGLRLQRFPTEVRNGLGFKHHSRGRFFAHRAAGCELRFVTAGPFVRVTLSALETDAEVIVFKGDRAHSRHRLPAGVVTSLFLEEPPFFTQVGPGLLPTPRFAPAVWRLLFNQDALVHYHRVEAYGHALRPPEPSETPASTWLAYGSSITFGANALYPANAYTQHAARRLGVDVLNLGLPGSCLCEPHVVDYLAGRADWDFATLELGVNLVELATPAEFDQRIRHLLATLHRAHPTKPLFVIDIYPNRADHALDRTTPAAVNTPIFRDLVRRAVADLASPVIHHLEAASILDDPAGLSTDLIHPSDEGHLRMGANLARLLHPALSVL